MNQLKKGQVNAGKSQNGMLLQKINVHLGYIGSKLNNSLPTISYQNTTLKNLTT